MTGKVITVFIDEDGMTFLMDETVKLFEGEGEVRRASHVLPTSFWARQWFRLLRRTLGEKGRIAEWTRRWKCEWLVDTSPVGGPILPQRFTNRQEAIAAEIIFLNDWYLERGFE